jgi:hypothetical protein
MVTIWNLDLTNYGQNAYFWTFSKLSRLSFKISAARRYLEKLSKNRKKSSKIETLFSKK